MQKIFSIIVAYNGMQRNWIQKCLDSLFNSSIKTEIIVIDNGSADGTINFIQKNYPKVDLITVNENLGFAKANNIGIKKAYEQCADYIFLLNQDAWVERDTVEKLIEGFKQMPGAGIVSPIHLNGSKTNLDYAFVDYIANHNTPNFISNLYFNRLKHFYETKFVNAAAWLLSRTCIEKVGGFDTSIFFHYGEDDNYCQRVLYHGFKIYITTIATICHDREERKEKQPSEYEKLREEILQYVYYGDILKDDKIIEDAIRLSKRKKIKQYLKALIRLQIKKLFLKRNMAQKELNFYLKIKKSRMKNKQGGLVWLEINGNDGNHFIKKNIS